MNITVNRASLLDAMNLAAQIIPSRSPKPVLQCVKLATDGQTLAVLATNLSASLKLTVREVTIEATGEVVTPADKLHAIVRAENCDTLCLSLSGDSLLVKGSDSQYKLSTHPIADYPIIDVEIPERDFVVEASVLNRLISQSMVAVASEATRFAFNGVLVKVGLDGLEFVATDGRRMAVTYHNTNAFKAKQAIIPREILPLIGKLAFEDVQFAIEENRVHISTMDATLSTNLVEGQFPPYENVIPKDTNKKMTASTGDLLAAVRRASLMTSEESRGVVMSFNKRGLVITGSSPTQGEAVVTFPCKYEGADMEIRFNPDFLIDALKVVETDEVTLKMLAFHRPGVIVSRDFKYVLMPVNKE